jgi:hypothetical protein
MSKQKTSNLIQVILFLAFIGGFFVINLITPDRAFSEKENRMLEQAPRFSFDSLFSGKFTSTFETYITDQFAGRDKWIGLKSFSELALQKKENNGVYLGEGGTLLTRLDRPDENRLETNISAVKKFAGDIGIPVYFSLIPSSTEIWADKLPKNAPSYGQLELIEDLYSGSGAVNIDTYSALYGHKDEYIYFRTDHHWTPLGAYYGYRALAEAMGFEPRPLESFTPATVSEDFFGTTYSSSGIRNVKPDTIVTFVEDYEGLTITNYTTGSAEEGVLYDYSKLETKDKYSMFLGGNTPLIQIKTGHEGPKLLILRDSYADVLIPFLFEHFSEIHAVDLRYNKSSIKDYIAENGIDEVVISYGVTNFVSDANIFLLGRQ